MNKQHMMIRLYMLCFLALTALSACTPKINPQQLADLRMQENELGDYKKTLDKAVETFYTEAYKLKGQATLLSNHPGWSDMQQIIQSYPSIKSVEGEEQACLKHKMALIRWNQKWNASAQNMYSFLLSLEMRSLDLMNASIVFTKALDN